jgi:hypothetical protein
MNLKEKIYLYANSTSQRCPKEMKTVLIEDFFLPAPSKRSPQGESRQHYENLKELTIRSGRYLSMLEKSSVFTFKKN